jgi:hypothetical protein
MIPETQTVAVSGPPQPRHHHGIDFLWRSSLAIIS